MHKTLALAAALLATSVPAASAAEVGFALGNAGSASTVASFDVGSPATALDGPTVITGLVGNEQAEAIDVRPGTGQLYLLGLDPNADGAHLYTLNPATGVATPVGAAIAQIDKDLAYDIDFDPVTGRLHVIAGYVGDRNFFVNPDTGAVILPLGADWVWGPGDPQEGQGAQLPAGAYTNSFPGATSSTMFGIDRPLLVRVGSPGGTPIAPLSGQIFRIGEYATGDFSFAPEGLDISGATGRAYALIIEDVLSQEDMQFTEIDLATAATGPRSIVAGEDAARDIALAPTSVVSLASASAAATEGSTAQVAIIRGGQGTGAVTASYEVAAGTAGATDLPAESGSVSFGPGETSKLVEVPLTVDRLREEPETFVVRLTSAAGNALSGAVTGGVTETAVTINDPAGPRLTIGPRRIRLARNGRVKLVVSCPASAQQRCRGTLQVKGKLRRGGKVRGLSKRKRFSVGAGARRNVRLKLSRGARRVLADRRLRATAVAQAQDAVSSTVATRRRVVLLPPR